METALLDLNGSVLSDFYNSPDFASWPHRLEVFTVRFLKKLPLLLAGDVNGVVKAADSLGSWALASVQRPALHKWKAHGPALSFQPLYLN